VFQNTRDKKYEDYKNDFLFAEMSVFSTAVCRCKVKFKNIFTLTLDRGDLLA